MATCYGPVDNAFAFLDSACEEGHHLTSPTAFSLSVYNILAATLSINLQLRGPSITISQGAFSLTAALNLAALWLDSGRAEVILLGAVEQFSAFLNQLIAELNQPFILPSRDGALFMLLSTGVSAAASIVRAGHALAPAYLPSLPYKTLFIYEDASALPSGPVVSLAQALSERNAPSQRCLHMLADENFSYIDVVRKHD